MTASSEIAPKYCLVLLNKTANTCKTVEFIGDCAANTVLEFMQELENGEEHFHGNSRPVFVIDVDDTQFDAWREERRSKGKPSPGELKPGQGFGSAVAAASHLGVNRRYVSQLLGNALHRDTQANGVTWSYRDPVL